MKTAGLIAGCILALALVPAATTYWIGAGGPGKRWEEGTPTDKPR